MANSPKYKNIDNMKKHLKELVETDLNKLRTSVVFTIQRYVRGCLVRLGRSKERIFVQRSSLTEESPSGVHKKNKKSKNIKKNS